MAKLLKLRRGTTSQHSSFTGAEGEVTVDTTKDTLVVHDGSTAGGVPLAKESTALTLIDEDNMASNSATRPPSQQSVKAYADTKAPLASPALTGTATGVNLTLSGDLTVNGTTTTINSTTLSVDDKNIELGSVSTPTDTTADGGGITLKGASDKTFNWVDATDSWTSSEHIHLGDGKKVIFGDSSDGYIKHQSGHFEIKNSTGNVYFDSVGSHFLRTNGSTTALTLDASQNATIAGTVSDSKGNLRSIPQNTQGSTYTLVAADAGKHILASGTITVPNSVFSAGDAVTIVNNTGSDLTITKTITTMYLGTDASSANRTLSTRGIATILFASGTVAYISGAGLS